MHNLRIIFYMNIIIQNTNIFYKTQTTQARTRTHTYAHTKMRISNQPNEFTTSALEDFVVFIVYLFLLFLLIAVTIANKKKNI